jgi:hypothetical protein
MSWSLLITNGDLALSGNGMATVTGGAKLVQDMTCAILEPMGNDPMHPSYGSTIDGGIMPDGTYAPGIIGSPNNAAASAFVQAEINRIAKGYQAQQVARYQADVATYGKSTLTADEVLLSVESVTAQGVQNQLLVQANIQTGIGDQPIAVPMSTGN